jgi:hypothetical protein
MELDHSQFAHRLASGMPDAIVYADAEGVIGAEPRRPSDP